MYIIILVCVSVVSIVRKLNGWNEANANQWVGSDKLEKQKGCARSACSGSRKVKQSLHSFGPLRKEDSTLITLTGVCAGIIQRSKFHLNHVAIQGVRGIMHRSLSLSGPENLSCTVNGNRLVAIGRFNL